MKLLIYLAALAAIIATARSQLPPSALPGFSRPEQPGAVPPAKQTPDPLVRSRAVTINCRTILAGRLQEDTWKTDWGSYNRDYASMQHVDVSVTRWQSTGPLFLEIVWFGRELSGEKRRVILRHDAIILRPEMATAIFHSGIVEGHVDKYVVLGERFATGHKIEGWYVRALAPDGTTIHDASSSHFLADIARDPASLASMTVIKGLEKPPQIANQ